MFTKPQRRRQAICANRNVNCDENDNNISIDKVSLSDNGIPSVNTITLYYIRSIGCNDKIK